MTPVLLVHSTGFTSRQWRKLGELLAPRHRVLAPDLIGYGAERWPTGTPFHFRDDVDLLLGLLDEPAHIVGHSYGGLLALQLALARPEAVRSISVYEPVAFGILDQPGDAAARDEIAQLTTYRPETAEAWLETFVDWWQAPGTWRGLPAATQQTFFDLGWKMSEEVASVSADRTPRARYATIAAPTLILSGDRTRPAERHVVQQLMQILPNATLERFPDLGHMGPITHAAQVNAAIAAFIASRDRA